MIFSITMSRIKKKKKDLPFLTHFHFSFLFEWLISHDVCGGNRKKSEIERKTLNMGHKMIHSFIPYDESEWGKVKMNITKG